jgi:glycosyltransferase involved in cell wall biosynthesis
LSRYGKTKITVKNYTLHLFPNPRNLSPLRKFFQIISIIKYATQLVRQEGIEITCAYDPLQLGFISTCIKLLTGCKSVIEINGHVKNALAVKIAANKSSYFFKKYIFNTVGWISLYFANGIKLLNEIQLNEWDNITNTKPCFIFPDFVPVSLFHPTAQDEGYILCMGFPFKVKGVDILIEAFAKLNLEFPELKLKIMGYCPEIELKEWQKSAKGIPGVHFCPPVPYSEVEKILQGCILLVLPSRTEGMGRVLIEAMACGKAVIGSNVGGIPNVIEHGENGFIFENENVEQLTMAIRKLLTDNNLRKNMENNALQRIQSTFSQQRYVDQYHHMLSGIMDGTYSRVKGIVVKGY